MATQKFQPHGTLKVARDGQIMILEGTGPWNLESIMRSGPDAEPVKQQLIGKPWAVIAIIYGEPIHVPDAAAFLIDVVKNDILNGRAGSALMVSECASPDFAVNHIADIYRKAGEVFEFFDNFDKAHAWATARLKAVSG